jgi:hypothetical protein
MQKSQNGRKGNAITMTEGDINYLFFQLKQTSKTHLVLTN